MVIHSSEQGDMEIHKPKPWHGLREFFKEYAIIVLGVVTALAAEQLAEVFHWRHEVEVERQALLAEAQDNLTSAAYREEQSGCLHERLHDIEEVFRRQARGEPLGLKHRVGRMTILVSSTGSWDIAVSGQALGHMSQSDKFRFSAAFDAYKLWNRLRLQEDDIWHKFELLNHADILNATDWSTLHEAYADAVAMDQSIGIAGSFMLREGTLDQTPTKPDPGVGGAQQQRDFCLPFI